MKNSFLSCFLRNFFPGCYLPHLIFAAVTSFFLNIYDPDFCFLSTGKICWKKIVCNLVSVFFSNQNLGHLWERDFNNLLIFCDLEDYYNFKLSYFNKAYICKYWINEYLLHAKGYLLIINLESTHFLFKYL